MAYYERNWDDLGKKIQDAVDRAVSSQDYQKLNQTVRQVVSQTVDVGTEAVRAVVDGTAGLTGSHNRRLYGTTAGKSVSGTLKTVFGSIFSFSAFSAFLGTIFSASLNMVALIMTLILLGGCLALTYSGVKTLGMVKRFKIYRRTLGSKTQCALKQLARNVGKNEDFVRRELWKMIGDGYFRQGHMDKEETSLITSDETYRYYEQSRLEFEARQAQARQAAAARQTATARQAREQRENTEKTAPTARDSQVQKVLERGNAFIAEIRKCNDAIPGEEISAKISRMELIIQRIFQRAEAHPEIVPDLQKMMDYYLPMTVKLLNAYAEMDAQPIQGETIQASKREIEDTLDTLNLAFEKLLDSVFQDAALDISSDISVLNTLLAQEGLTEDELSQVRQRKFQKEESSHG